MHGTHLKTLKCASQLKKKKKTWNAETLDADSIQTDFVYPVPDIYAGYRIYHLPPQINYIIIKIFKRFIKLDKFIYSNNLFFWETKTHTKDEKESQFLIQKQLKQLWKLLKLLLTITI